MPRRTTSAAQAGQVSPYLSRASLAAALEVPESKIDAMVERGVLPRPIPLFAGCLRWRWATVDMALASLGGERDVAAEEAEEVRRAIEASKAGRRGRAA